MCPSPDVQLNSVPIGPSLGGQVRTCCKHLPIPVSRHVRVERTGCRDSPEGWLCTLSSPSRTGAEWVLKGLLDICHTKPAPVPQTYPGPKDALYTAKETLRMGFG